MNFDNSNNDITMQMNGGTPYTVHMGISSSGTIYHNKLKNRDTENQHPIKAITGLERELSEKLEENDLGEISAGDIIELWNSI